MTQRTTLSLDDDIARKLRRRAADERRSLNETANDLLRQALARQAAEQKTSRVRLEVFDVGEVLVDVNDREAL